MYIKRVKVRVPATTANLGPGFDVLALALRLYNTVEMEMGPGKSGKKLQIDIVGEGEEIHETVNPPTIAADTLSA